MIAKKDAYIEKAYQHLQIISQDKEKRLEYETREKASTIVSEAQASAQGEIAKIDSAIEQKRMELSEMQRQFDAFKANMEGLLVSHLEMLKNSAQN